MGDCNGGDNVLISELIVGVNISQGIAPVTACPAADRDGRGTVTIDELIAAVNSALDGCPIAPTATESPRPFTPTRTSTMRASETRPLSTPTVTGVRATETATPQAIASDTPVATASPTETELPPPTRSSTRTATVTRTPTSTRTVGPIVIPNVGGGVIDIDGFQADDGTLYFVIGVDADPNGVAIGAQITSLAISNRNPLAVREPFFPGDPIITSVSGVTPGGLPELRHIRRTMIFRDLPSNDVVLEDPPRTDNGDFQPDGSGLLTLPGGAGTIGFDSAVPITVATGSGDSRVPAAVTKQVQRRRAPVTFFGEMLVFPEPAENRCVDSANAGESCTGDADCRTNCRQVGQLCCGRASRPPTCGGQTGTAVVCDPNADAGGDEFMCSSSGTNCRDDLGGEVAGQSITLDDHLNTRIGDPDSQPDAVDGIFLRSQRDLIVFIVAPDRNQPATNASASGFLLAGTCVGGGLQPGCASDADCARGDRGPCREEFSSRIAIEAVSGEGSAKRVRLRRRELRETILGSQSFTSSNGTRYFALAANPAPSTVGVQVTSLILSSGQVVAISEIPGQSGDSVLTSLSTMVSGGIPCSPPLSSIRRTSIVTGLTSNFIEDMGNPLNGIFDAEANGGDGLLTLPGGTRTVSLAGTGTESVLPITESSGADMALVPAATTATVTRRIGMMTFANVPTIVFPNPPGPVVTSDGSICAGGSNPGTPCSPAAPPPDTCTGGGSCTDFGGAAPGQNVTLDGKLDRRVGNPASQGDQIDGFLLRNSTDMIVFVAPPCAATFNGSASGFAVTGSCSNRADVPCSTDDDCFFGGQCTFGLPGRTVLRTARTPANATARTQLFVSANNKYYVVVRVDPSPGSVGAQITSMVVSSGIGVPIVEDANNPPDPVVSSLSTFLTGDFLNFVPTFRRTAIITGLPQNNIENMGNPLNGIFDPMANGGDGLLTLPGGTRTVSYQGTGTEPVVTIGMSTGAGDTLMPAATNITRTRRVGMTTFSSVPTIVFPNPPGSPVTSSGSTCAGGSNPGTPCSPAAPPPDTCTGGGTCTNFGGETAGQNVTLDDTLGSRVGNPASQGNSIDGFFLPSTTAAVVFMAEGNPGLEVEDVSVSFTGFRVSGTCSNLGNECSADSDCPRGVCTQGLAARTVQSP